MHLLQWPKAKLVLPSIPHKVVKAEVLTGGSITFTQYKQGIELTVAAADQNEMDTVIALELDQSATSIKPVAALE